MRITIGTGIPFRCWIQLGKVKGLIITIYYYTMLIRFFTIVEKNVEYDISRGVLELDFVDLLVYLILLVGWLSLYS